MKPNGADHDRANADTARHLSRYFDAHGEIWRAAYGRDRERWYEYHHLRRREETALELIAAERKGTAADLGCGAGHALVAMKRMGFARVVGIDLSEVMLARARERIEAEGLAEAIELVKGDARHLDVIESQSVDACIALGVIEYLEEDGAFLREVNRILRPGGAAVIQTRNYHCLYLRTREIVHALVPRLRQPIAYREHKPGRFRSILPEFGFRVEAERFSHFHVLYPLNSIPLVRRMIRPLDNWLSKACERFSTSRLSVLWASMYLVKVRKTSEPKA